VSGWSPDSLGDVARGWRGDRDDADGDVDAAEELADDGAGGAHCAPVAEGAVRRSPSVKAAMSSAIAFVFP
jgi:hypothetical protein